MPTPSKPLPREANNSNIDQKTTSKSDAISAVSGGETSTSTKEENQTPANIADVRKNAIKKMIDSSSKTDRRVCLKVAPSIHFESDYDFAKRVAYVLGTQDVSYPKSVGSISSDSVFRGFLRSQLGKAQGLIFPYTPKITMSYNVNYEKTDFIHSNLSFNSYKNSPPPTISLNAKFTADTKANAIHMLSAVWFLQACSKCDTGLNTMSKGDNKNTANRSGAGLPPPVLYLNGYANLMDNIPVIIEGFSVDYPEDIDYVRLDLQMAINKPKQRTFSDPLEESLKQTNPILDDNFSFFTSENAKGVSDDKYSILTFWLPMTMSIPINLRIQPNIAQDIKTFSLDAYKSGVLKNTGISNLISSNGSIDVGGMTVSGTSNTSNTGSKNLNRSFIPTGWSW